MQIINDWKQKLRLYNLNLTMFDEIDNMLEKNNEIEITPEKSKLGKKTEYYSHYDASLLFPISRKMQRAEIKIAEKLPFSGFDIWNHYEVSWLNDKGKPIVAFAEVIYSCDSPFLIESKSMKLYFNSLNNTKFKNLAAVIATITRDIAERVGAEATVNIIPLSELHAEKIAMRLEGIYLDELDIDCSTYQVEPLFLKTENQLTEEILYSDLLKSNCLVTGQPDWASVQIAYQGNKINHEGLLRYIISFRNHSEFSEHCIERIFMDIMQYCQPKELVVYGRYTRRGGLDINPYRSTNMNNSNNLLINTRLFRQ